MFKRLVRNIRQKSKDSRDNIALTIAVVFTGIVFLIWLLNLPAKFAALEEKNNPDAEDNSPGFSKLFEGFSDQVSDLKESATTTEEISTQIEVPPMSSTTRERISRYASSTNVSTEEDQGSAKMEELEVSSNQDSSSEQEQNIESGQREVRITTNKASTSTSTIE